MKIFFKQSVEAWWGRVKPAIKKHGDVLLFFLALMILVMILLRPAGGRNIITLIESPGKKIVFTCWTQDDLVKDTFLALIKEFESHNEEITVTIIEKSYEELRQELFSGNGVLPGDVFMLDVLWIPELLSRGVIENAEEPFVSFINVLYYNVEILKAAGFSRPPKTRSEFLAYARAVVGGKKNLSGLAMGGNSSRGIYDDVYPWIWAAGTQLINNGIPAINSRQVTESLSFLATLNREGLIIPDAFYRSSSDKLDDFISGRAAFMIAPARDIDLVRERMGANAFDITAIPHPDNFAGNAFFAVAAWTAGIHSDSKQKEEAMLFVDFLAGKKTFLSESAKVLPDVGSQDFFYSKVWDITISGDSSPDFTNIAGEHELEEVFREELLSLFAENSSPAETAAAIQVRWEEILRTLRH